MKTIRNLFLSLAVFVTGLLSSCDYLDIVPDEKSTAEDAFEDTNAALRFMYSCYSYLPTPRDGTSSLDLMTGDEVVTAFEHETFASFPKGNYTPSNITNLISYWDTFFQGLRQCYILLNGIDQVPKLPEATKADYIAQAKFLIAYYHYLLVRNYGPVILIKEEPFIYTSPGEYLARTPYDECVQFVCDLFDEAARELPATRPVREYGLATSVAAKAFKAKMLLYAASPLFNGNSKFYANFVDKDGTPLMPTAYDPKKWEKARDAFKEAIQVAEAAGHELYTNTAYDNGNKYPEDPIQHRLRYNIMEAGNKEIIFADSREVNAYGIQNKSLPYSSGSAWNGIAPTWAMLNRFYSKNGLPIDQDPEYNYSRRMDVVTVADTLDMQAKPGKQTLRFNLGREPRFYAWIAFQGGYYEVLSASSNGAYANDPSYEKGEGRGRLVCDFILNGNCSRGTYDKSNGKFDLRASNYSPTGYLNKKGVPPEFAVSTSLQGSLDYPWPLMRLADLYLGYAECCVETNDLPTARTYLNKVRERAGIPTVEESWVTIAKKTLTQDLLRDIVRQERMVEFYLENQNFWDMRRWLMGEKYFGVKAQGMNVDGGYNAENFFQLTEVIFERKFDNPAHYLMPIPIDDINKNMNLVQNPGY